MAPVFHVIFLKFSSTATAEQIAKTVRGVLTYKDHCLHPETQEPLLVSAKGGVNQGTEGLDGGFTHVIILEFASHDDLQTYLRNDHHNNFDAWLARDKILDDERVLDFTPGVF